MFYVYILAFCCLFRRIWKFFLFFFFFCHRITVFKIRVFVYFPTNNKLKFTYIRYRNGQMVGLLYGIESFHISASETWSSWTFFLLRHNLIKNTKIPITINNEINNKRMLWFIWFFLRKFTITFYVKTNHRSLIIIITTHDHLKMCRFDHSFFFVVKCQPSPWTVLLDMCVCCSCHVLRITIDKRLCIVTQSESYWLFRVKAMTLLPLSMFRSLL